MRLARLLACIALCGSALPSAWADEVVVQRLDEAEPPSVGPAQAAVTVEFFCGLYTGGCATYHALLLELAARHPQRLRIVYRQMQTSLYREGSAVAEATIEAWSQGRFLPFLEAFYPVAQRRGLSRKDLDRVARQAGLDLDKLAAALEDGRHRPRLEDDEVWAARLGVERPPALVWNGHVEAPRRQSIDDLERLYDDAYARARGLLDEGVAPRRLYKTLLRKAAREQADLATQAGTPTRFPGSGPYADGPLDLDGPRVAVPQEGAPERGEPTADVTIVVFADFQVHGYVQLMKTLAKLEDAYPGRLRIVFKHFPLAIRPDAQKAAEAAACAADQGKFWAYHDRLLASYGRLKRADLVRAAADVGLDVDQLLDDLDAGRCAARVKQDVADGTTLGVDQVPTLFVNGLKIKGARSFGELRAVVDQELAPGILEAATSDLQ